MPQIRGSRLQESMVVVSSASYFGRVFCRADKAMSASASRMTSLSRQEQDYLSAAVPPARTCHISAADTLGGAG